MASQVVTAEKRYRMSLLLDAYGELLTDKQRTFLHRYYEEDSSFGEIAHEFLVTRQAIFDAVKHGEASLENYERVLGLVRSSQGSPSVKIQEISSPDRAPADLPTSAARIRALAERLSGRAEVDATEVIGELEALAEELEVSTGGDVRVPAAVEPAPSRRPTLLRSNGPEVD